MTVVPDQRKPHLVAEALIHEIRNGRWKVGERLPSERDLAKALGVGRNAVREALTTLKLAGRIDTRLGEGSFVTSVEALSPAEDEASFLATLSIADALEIREDLEVAAVSLAIHRARNSDLLRINQVADTMGRHVAAGDYGAYLASTLDLHLEIVRASHSVVLIRLVTELIDKHRDDQWVLEKRYTPKVGAYSLELHQDLARAVVDRDYAAAVRTACRHYEDYPIAVS
jgi:DNA-binding FadR family transcriptional regulator